MSVEKLSSEERMTSAIGFHWRNIKVEKVQFGFKATLRSKSFRDDDSNREMIQLDSCGYKNADSESNSAPDEGQYFCCFIHNFACLRNVKTTSAAGDPCSGRRRVDIYVTFVFSTREKCRRRKCNETRCFYKRWIKMLTSFIALI